MASSSTASLEAYLSRYGVAPARGTWDSAQAAEPALERLKILDAQLDASLAKGRTPLFPLEGRAPLLHLNTNAGTGVQPSGGPAVASTSASSHHVVLQQQEQQQQQQRRGNLPTTPPQGHMPESRQVDAATVTEKLRHDWEQLKSRHASIARASGGLGLQWSSSQQGRAAVNRVLAQSQPRANGTEPGQQTSTGLVLGILNDHPRQQSLHAASSRPLTSPTALQGPAALQATMGRSCNSVHAPQPQRPAHGSLSAAPTYGLPAAHVPSGTCCYGPGQLVAYQPAPRAPPTALRVSTGVQTEESSFWLKDLRPGLDLMQQRQQQQQQQQLQQSQVLQHSLPPHQPQQLQQPPGPPADLQQAVQDALLAIMSQPPPQLLPVLAYMLQQQQQQQDQLSPQQHLPAPANMHSAVAWPRLDHGSAAAMLHSPLLPPSQPQASHPLLGHQGPSQVQQQPVPEAPTSPPAARVAQPCHPSFLGQAAAPPHLQPPTPDSVSSWRTRCTEGAGAKAMVTGWRAAAAAACAATPVAAGSTLVGKRQMPTPNASASAQASPSASAATAAAAVCGVPEASGTHASLPPLPPLLAARLADHLRRKERRLHRPARPCSPASTSSSAGSVNGSLSQDGSLAQLCATKPSRAARPARWRKGLQLEAHQEECNSSSDESL